MGEDAKLMTDVDLILNMALVSPFYSERQLVRDVMTQDEFAEVFVYTPLSVEKERNVF